MSHDKPNIILIMADDMGYSDIGCFGSEIQTPHINGISDSGVTFTQRITVPVAVLHVRRY